MDVESLRALLELGWPAIITVAFVILAKWYRDDTQNQIGYLRARVDALEGALTKAGIAFDNSSYAGD